MINEMRSANFLSKISTMNPLSLNAMDTIAMATMNGAKTLGNATQTGSLKIGKAADFIAMDLDEIETLPIFNIPAQVVYASSRQQVTDVWVAGQQLMKDRVLLTLDETDLKSKAHFWGDKITKGLSL
jgi:5-methylthioadenosine/S-adenosylhomocysteine deaminase